MMKNYDDDDDDDDDGTGAVTNSGIGGGSGDGDGHGHEPPKPIGEHCKLIGKAIEQNSRQSFEKIQKNYNNSTPISEWSTDEAIGKYSKEAFDKIKSDYNSTSDWRSEKWNEYNKKSQELTNYCKSKSDNAIDELYYGFSDGSTGSSSTRSTAAAASTSTSTSTSTPATVVDNNQNKNNDKKKEAIILRC